MKFYKILIKVLFLTINNNYICIGNDKVIDSDDINASIQETIQAILTLINGLGSDKTKKEPQSIEESIINAFDNFCNIFPRFFYFFISQLDKNLIENLLIPMPLLLTDSSLIPTRYITSQPRNIVNLIIEIRNLAKINKELKSVSFDDKKTNENSVNITKPIFSKENMEKFVQIKDIIADDNIPMTSILFSIKEILINFLVSLNQNDIQLANDQLFNLKTITINQFIDKIKNFLSILSKQKSHNKDVKIEKLIMEKYECIGNIIQTIKDILIKNKNNFILIDKENQETINELNNKNKLLTKKNNNIDQVLPKFIEENSNFFIDSWLLTIYSTNNDNKSDFFFFIEKMFQELKFTLNETKIIDKDKLKKKRQEKKEIYKKIDKKDFTKKITEQITQLKNFILLEKKKPLEIKIYGDIILSSIIHCFSEISISIAFLNIRDIIIPPINRFDITSFVYWITIKDLNDKIENNEELSKIKNQYNEKKILSIIEEEKINIDEYCQQIIKHEVVNFTYYNIYCDNETKNEKKDEEIPIIETKNSILIQKYFSINEVNNIKKKLIKNLSSFNATKYKTLVNLIDQNNNNKNDVQIFKILKDQIKNLIETTKQNKIRNQNYEKEKNILKFLFNNWNYIGYDTNKYNLYLIEGYNKDQMNNIENILKNLTAINQDLINEDWYLDFARANLNDFIDQFFSSIIKSISENHYKIFQNSFTIFISYIKEKIKTGLNILCNDYPLFTPENIPYQKTKKEETIRKKKLTPTRNIQETKKKNNEILEKEETIRKKKLTPRRNIQETKKKNTEILENLIINYSQNPLNLLQNSESNILKKSTDNDKKEKIIIFIIISIIIKQIIAFILSIRSINNISQ